jgi:polyisoprenoid-binding protein YceI
VITPIAAASSLRVWTYKEGLLSKVAHDLCIEATSFQAPVTLDGRRFTVDVTVPVRALRVLGQVKDGLVSPLSEKDHREIESNITGKHVLDADRAPDVRFTGQGDLDAKRVDGKLTLRGSTQPLSFPITVREQDGKLVVEGEVRFKQTTFGIKPYSALLGALKVQDEVRVSWSVAYPKP